MGTACKIRCSRCGAQIDYSTYRGSGQVPQYGGWGNYVEMESALRCPSCFNRLNCSQNEFVEQVETIEIDEC